MKRSGTADLPLHNGHVLPWLASRMTELGTAIAEQIILNYGCSEFLTRLSDPFWFQSFGAVMGMDWHSSGITTSVLGALKGGINPRFSELGVMVCGGRGRHSIRTPDELRTFSAKTGLDGEALARTSRLTTLSPVAFSFIAFLCCYEVRRIGFRAGSESRKSPGAAVPKFTQSLSAANLRMSRSHGHRTMRRFTRTMRVRWSRISVRTSPSLPPFTSTTCRVQDYRRVAS